MLGIFSPNLLEAASKAVGGFFTDLHEYAAEYPRVALSSPVLCPVNSGGLASPTFWKPPSHSKLRHHRIHLVCFSPLRDHFLSLPDIQCLENHCSVDLILLLVFQMEEKPGRMTPFPLDTNVLCGLEVIGHGISWASQNVRTHSTVCP